MRLYHEAGVMSRGFFSASGSLAGGSQICESCQTVRVR